MWNEQKFSSELNWIRGLAKKIVRIHRPNPQDYDDLVEHVLWRMIRALSSHNALLSCQETWLTRKGRYAILDYYRDADNRTINGSNDALDEIATYEHGYEWVEVVDLVDSLPCSSKHKQTFLRHLAGETFDMIGPSKESACQRRDIVRNMLVKKLQKKSKYEVLS